MTSIADQNFICMLSKTLAEANRFLMTRMQECGVQGLVPSHGDILFELFKTQPISMQELAERIHRDPSTVTTLVKKLVQEGYAQTKKGESDKRVVEVFLTKKGAALQEDFDKISKELLKTQMQYVSKKDFETTCEVLEQIKDNFAENNQRFTE